MLKILNGLDEFFKSAPLPQNRSKIKGLKMEITALKNSIVKANQRRSEYTAYIEEEAQLRKLGITNA
jgi:cell shape-determining protein MreC